jgi:3-hydroxyisobutyrate dehydrogenase
MGTAFATRLVELGHAVSVWNRTAAGMGKAVAAGATGVGTLAELAQGADVLISSLTDKAALDSVVDGAGGLLSSDVQGKLWIEMSTLLPDQQEALAAKAEAVGCQYLECPVGGTVGPALKGALLGMAGGSAAAWDRGRPILEGLCKRVEHLGPVGSGSAMKLAVNLPLALYWASMGEALSLLKSSGIAPAVAASIMSDSSAGPAVLKNRLEVVVKTLDGEDQPGTFDINGLRKDLLLALEWATRGGASMTLSKAARDLYDAAVAEGLGGFDGSSLTRHMLTE